jgi:hypothetical protein
MVAKKVTSQRENGAMLWWKESQAIQKIEKMQKLQEPQGS